MNETISRVGKWIMGTAATLGVLVSSAKNLTAVAAFAASLNGWTVLFVLSALALVALGVAASIDWLTRHFKCIADERLDIKLALSQKIADERYQEFDRFRSEMVRFVNANKPKQ